MLSSSACCRHWVYSSFIFLKVETWFWTCWQSTDRLLWSQTISAFLSKQPDSSSFFFPFLLLSFYLISAHFSYTQVIGNQHFTSGFSSLCRVMGSPLVLGGQTSLVVAFLLMRSPGFRTPPFLPGTMDGFPLLPICPVTALIVVVYG